MKRLSTSLCIPLGSCGAGAKQVEVPAGTKVVQLRLDLPAKEYPAYRAVLQTEKYLELPGLDQLKASTVGAGKVVVLNLPADLLTPGYYQVSLSGLTPAGELERIGTYPFQIEKK